MKKRLNSKKGCKKLKLLKTVEKKLEKIRRMLGIFFGKNQSIILVSPKYLIKVGKRRKKKEGIREVLLKFFLTRAKNNRDLNLKQHFNLTHLEKLNRDKLAEVIQLELFPTQL